MKRLIFIITIFALVAGCAEKPKKEPITVPPPYSGTMAIIKDDGETK